GNNLFSPIGSANSGEQIAHNHIGNYRHDNLNNHGEHDSDRQCINGLIVQRVALIVGAGVQGMPRDQDNRQATDQASDQSSSRRQQGSGQNNGNRKNTEQRN